MSMVSTVTSAEGDHFAEAARGRVDRDHARGCGRVQKSGFDAAFGGARRSEEKCRAKERIIVPCCFISRYRA